MEHFYVAVTLIVHPGKEEAFRAYEERALGLVTEHGGEISLLLRLTERAQAGVPYEFHLLRFPEQKSFSAFRADPRTLALGAERDQVIESTQLAAGTEFSLPKDAR